MRTPKGATNPAHQTSWQGRAPVPNAYMSPSDFSLSPMSQRLLRGSRKSKVVVSHRAMGLPKDPGFLPDPKEQVQESAHMEDKENGFVPVMLGENRIGKVKSFGGSRNSNAKPLASAAFAKPLAKAKKGLAEVSGGGNHVGARLVR
eukprot:TRINITY_DN12210_c0_g1_i1.p1 TRINITY_DN12210_c0_g1~~TRINITY_DN12210_c0_g1_i1.p1  ORF type:complete len:146 (+),score=17.40 TRINITY_DN12210_c0_g1_i1:170-607(+)